MHRKLDAGRISVLARRMQNVQTHLLRAVVERYAEIVKANEGLQTFGQLIEEIGQITMSSDDTRHLYQGEVFASGNVGLVHHGDTANRRRHVTGSVN